MKKNRIKKQEEQREQFNEEENTRLLKRKTIKEIIAPSGIDASDIDRLEIISSTKRYARSFLYHHFLEWLFFPNCLEIYICLGM